MSDKAKNILFKNQARQKIYQGLHQVALEISKTIGQNIKNKNDSVDGIERLVKQLNFKDDFEKLGAEFAKQTAHKIKENYNDGIATSIIILDIILKEGIKLINAGVSPFDIKAELDLALKRILTQIDLMARPVENFNDIKKIANNFSFKNKLIAETITECFKKVGKSCIFTFEENGSLNTEIEIVSGLEFKAGYSNPYFCTNLDKMTVELEFCDVLIINHSIFSIQDVLPILIKRTSNKNILIIVKDIQPDSLSSLVMNKLKGTLNVAVVKAPFEKITQKEIFENVSVLTGAKIINNKDDLLKATTSVLGSVRKVILSKDKSILIQAENDALNTKFKRKIAIIRIKAANKSELDEKIKTFESCLFATKAAIDHGVVAGAGLSLPFAASRRLYSEFKIIAPLLKKAVEALFVQIVLNAGHNPHAILEKVYQMGYPNGFNTANGKIENFFDANIVDPAIVVKNSLSSAIAAASSILLTDALVIDTKD